MPNSCIMRAFWEIKLFFFLLICDAAPVILHILRDRIA